MPRKKHNAVENAQTETSAVTAGDAKAHVPNDGVSKLEPTQPIQAQPQTDPAQPQADTQEQKQWTNSYTSIFTSVVRGFEMGEDRRYKQRVFKFSEKPEQAIIDKLKENGFTYRPNEKAWTIPANPATRQLTERLAREFAAGTQVQTR